MPVTIIPPETVSRVTFECDRCHKKVDTDVPMSPAMESSLNHPSALTLPEGWKSALHPDTHFEDAQVLYFDRRDCMGVWFGRWIRVTYGGPEELPPRQRPTKGSVGEPSDGATLTPENSIFTEGGPGLLPTKDSDYVDPTPTGPVKVSPKRPRPEPIKNQNVKPQRSSDEE